MEKKRKNHFPSKNTEMDSVQLVLASAQNILARRDHSEAELARKLQIKGFPSEAVEVAIVRLRNAGFLDDRRFAEQWTGSAVRNGRAFGPRIRQELARRGVPGEIIAEILADLASECDERQVLNELVARKFAGFIPQTACDREKRRVMGYLQRRGFSSAVIWEFITKRQ